MGVGFVSALGCGPSDYDCQNRRALVAGAIGYPLIGGATTAGDGILVYRSRTSDESPHHGSFVGGRSCGHFAGGVFDCPNGPDDS